MLGGRGKQVGDLVGSVLSSENSDLAMGDLPESRYRERQRERLLRQVQTEFYVRLAVEGGLSEMDVVSA